SPKLEERNVDDLVGFLNTREGGCLHNLQADIETDRDQYRADKKSDTPAPRKEGGFGKIRQQVDHSRTQQQSGWHTHLWPAAIEAAPAGRRVLDCHQHRAAPFAADADTLKHAKEKQHHRSPDADRSISWQQADQECCDAHNEDRENEHGLPPDAIAVVTEEDAADRSRYEADEKRCVSEQGADQRIEVGKEEFVEHERSDHAK